MCAAPIIAVLVQTMIGQRSFLNPGYPTNLVSSLPDTVYPPHIAIRVPLLVSFPCLFVSLQITHIGRRPTPPPSPAHGRRAGNIPASAAARRRTRTVEVPLWDGTEASA